jgi:hypothetical protein
VHVVWRVGVEHRSVLVELQAAGEIQIHQRRRATRPTDLTVVATHLSAAIEGEDRRVEWCRVRTK